MKKVNCRACRVEIEEAEPNQALSRDALAHIEACSSCRELRDEQLALNHLVGSLEKISAPPDFDFRLRARLAAAKSANGRRPALNLFSPSQATLAIAALFAVLITGGVFYKQINSVGSKSVRPADVATAPPAEKIQQPTIQKQNVPPVTTDDSRGAQNSESIAQGTGDVAGSVSQRDSKRRTERISASRMVNSPDSDFPGVIERSLNPAPVINLTGVPNRTLTDNSPVVIPVRASTQPVKVLLGDTNKETHAVSLKPFTLGSQEFIERKGGSPAPTTVAQGVW